MAICEIRRKPLQITNLQIQKSHLFESGGRLLIERNEIHVWVISLETENASDLRRFLSADELQRAARFRAVRDRMQFVAARGFLRAILGKYLAEHPERIEFAYNQFGKPSVGNDAQKRLKFNLSHSGETAVYAVTLDDEIGVDLEFINREAVNDEIAAVAFSPREFEIFKSLPESKRAETFYKCWTVKEAFVKAHGDGLSINPKEIETLVYRNASTSEPDGSFDTANSSDWRLIDLPEIKGYAAGLVVKSANKKHLRFSNLTE